LEQRSKPFYDPLQHLVRAPPLSLRGLSASGDNFTTSWTTSNTFPYFVGVIYLTLLVCSTGKKSDFPESRSSSGWHVLALTMRTKKVKPHFPLVPPSPRNSDSPCNDRTRTRGCRAARAGYFRKTIESLSPNSVEYQANYLVRGK